MTIAIRHDPVARRFEAHVDDELCKLEYTLAGGVMTIVHTEVPQAVGGRGIAGELVRAALETARSDGWKVQPRCAYTAVWMKRHPEYDDLRATA